MIDSAETHDRQGRVVRLTRRRSAPRFTRPSLRRLKFQVIEPINAHLRTLLKRHEVSEVNCRHALAEAAIVAVLVVKDERARLPFMLNYYRGLGVEHFIAVDNRSSDGSCEFLVAEPDVSVFAADGNFGAARYGNDWVNGLLRRHCLGKWVLWVDADELLVFSTNNTVGLSDLVGEMRRRKQRSLQTIMVDMYSDAQPSSNVVASGLSPLESCRLFDRDGYEYRLDEATGTTWVKGGVRGRLFFDDIWMGPALNKSPLVQWRRHYAFLKVAHELWPRQLNGETRKMNGALLHFKFTATSLDKINDIGVRNQHTEEYDAYSIVDHVRFVDESSTARYEGARSLVENQLFDPLV